MTFDRCTADGLAPLSLAVWVLSITFVAAVAVIMCAVRTRTSLLAVPPFGSAQVPSRDGLAGLKPAGAAQPVDAPLGGHHPAHRTSGFRAADGGESSGAESDGSGDKAAVPLPLHSPAVLLDHDTLATLHRKLWYERPCEADCFDRRLSNEFKGVVWGCFTQRGLINMCLRGLGCLECEGEGPMPPALVSFKKLIPHMVNILWLDCYHKSNIDEP